MTAELARHGGLERRLARLYGAGTAVASLTIGIGLLLAWSAPLGLWYPRAGSVIVMVGTALFLLLPVSRLVVMIWTFARERDRRFALIAALVLAVIGAGVAIGLLLGTAGG